MASESGMKFQSDRGRILSDEKCCIAMPRYTLYLAGHIGWPDLSHDGRI